MPNLRFLSCLLAFLLSLPAVAEPQANPRAKPQAGAQAKPQAKPQAMLQRQNAQFFAPKLSQLEPLYAFANTLEGAFGSAELSEGLGKAGLYLLLLPATQPAWTQKGIAPDKPLVVQTQPQAFACMGVADDKALAAAVQALPGEESLTQKGALSYRLIHTGPEHRFVLFWNSNLLCLRPHSSSETLAALPKALEKTLTEASALSKTAANQSWPLLSTGKDLQLHMEPVSAKQLKLRLNAANNPWKLKTTQTEKTALASISTQAGLLLKLHGVPASEVFRYTDFISALSPKGDPLRPQKQVWFSRLASLLAEEFLAKMDFPNGRNTERLLLVAKIKPGQESAFDAWLAEMPKDEAAAAGTAVLPTQRSPLVFARKGNWAFAATSQEQALAQIEQLEKAKPEAAPHFVGLVFPKTLDAILQGETFASFALGLSARQMRLLRFNAPLRNLINTLELVRVEALPKANNAAELLLDISLSP